MHLVAVGGSDAGISAALRARELAPDWDVSVLVADAYPNFSICGLPYYLSGDVPRWHDLAHRTLADLQVTGMQVRTDTRATRIDVTGHRVEVATPDGSADVVPYDRLVIGTGALSTIPPIAGLRGTDPLGPDHGVHTLRSMADAHAVMKTIETQDPRTAVIIGAGYIGLEMAEAFVARGIRVTQVEALPEVLPTLDPELGALVHHELESHGVEVRTHTTVTAVERRSSGASGLSVSTVRSSGERGTVSADIVLVVVGVRPDTQLARDAGASLGVKGAIQVDEHMATTLPDVYAAGDCAVTLHRLLGDTWLPLGTTAHKQGRIAGENAIGGNRRFAGSLGTQVVKVFDLVAARTGLRDHEAAAAAMGWSPRTVATTADDHKRYYPGASAIDLRVTGDSVSGLLLGAQLVGHRSAEISKRVDTLATAIFHDMPVEEISDLDLSYTPPLGSPWDAVQMAAQAWVQASPHDPPLTH
ncbi:FAD-dependent oxidoreductase [Cellulomonas hominis]